jgi:hypothetical protein
MRSRGWTRYVLKSRPFALIDCQRSAGAPYVTWGSAPREGLVLTKGELRKIAHAKRVRCFAACCGTHLFFEDTKDSDAVDVTIQHQLHRKKRFGSKTNCPGLNSTSRSRLFKRLRRLRHVKNNSTLILLFSGLLDFLGRLAADMLKRMLTTERV